MGLKTVVPVHCIWLIALLLLATAGQAKAIPGDFNGYHDDNLTPIEISELTLMPVRQPAEFLIADRNTSIDSLPLYRFRPLRTENLNQGLTDQAFWVRFRVQNSRLNLSRQWVLYHEHPYLDYMSVYVQNQGGNLVHHSLSDRRPFTSRPIDFRTLAVAHRTPPQSYTDVYVRLSFSGHETMSLSLFLASPVEFNKMAQDTMLLQGLYFGVMLLLLVVAVVFGIMLRQRVYWYYALFITASGLMWAKLTGVSYQYLWPQSVFMQNEGFNIVFLLTSITALQFSRVFLETPKLLPRWDKTISVLQIIMLAGIGLRLLGVYEEVLILSYVSLCTLILLPILGWFAYRKGMSYARWYAIAWSFYALGLLLSVISAGTNIFEWGMAPLAYAQLGSVIEAVFLLIALGERLVSWEKDRTEALKEALSDEITGLGNRRKLQAAYQEARKRFTGEGSPEFLALLAVDRFDDLLEQHGHEAADRVLKDIGATLRGLSRDEDVSVRYAGEEFVLLLQAPSMRAAYELIEQIRENFEQTPTQYRGLFIKHTFTAGLTEVTAGGKFISQQEAIVRAETALKQARAAGGNRCTIYRPGEQNQE
ncbi:MAG: diguanylate cyclase [Idiomarina sp.]